MKYPYFIYGHPIFKWVAVIKNVVEHDDVIKWKHFPRNWPFVRAIHRSPVNSRHKGQWRGALMFSLICVWINAWVNNPEAGDLRRYRAHYDVIVMAYKATKSVMPYSDRSMKDRMSPGDKYSAPLSTHCGLVMLNGNINSGSTPSRYLNQCWLTTSGIFCHSLQCNVSLNAQDVKLQVFKTYTYEITATSPREQWLNAFR